MLLLITAMFTVLPVRFGSMFLSDSGQGFCAFAWVRIFGRDKRQAQQIRAPNN